MFQRAQNGSSAYRDQNFPLIFTGQYNQSEWSLLLFFLQRFEEKTYNNWRMKESGTNPVHAIFKIILSLHILLWRPEIRPRIALRLRANLVLLGRRRWKRFLEYWEGKTLENYFCAGRECCGLSKILLHRDFDQVDFVQMHFMHETSFLL